MPIFMHIYSLFLCSPASGHPTFPSNKQKRQRAVSGMGVDQDCVPGVLWETVGQASSKAWTFCHISPLHLQATFPLSTFKG